MSAPNWRHGVAVLRWSVGWAVMRVWLPAVARVAQSEVWPRRWHALVGRMVTWRKQVAAVVWTGAWVYLLGASSWTAALVAPAVALCVFGAGRVVYRLTVRGRVRSRFGARAGFASYDELRRDVSADAVRHAAVKSRPAVKHRASYPPLRWWQRPEWAWTPSGRVSEVELARIPATDVGTFLGRTAVGPPLPVPVYAGHRDVVLLVAAPQTMKTAWMAAALAVHPGAALSTQTKPETFWLTREARTVMSHSGRVELLDPEGLSGEKSTFRWPPQVGCAEWRVARDRAAAFALAGDPNAHKSENGQWFAQRTTWLLRAFLLIADVTGRDMRDVHRWSQSPEQAGEAANLMQDPRYRDTVPAGWLDAVLGVLTNPSEKTVGNIFTTVSGAVEFMNDPDVAALCTLADGEAAFDVRSFVADRGTVYLIASERDHDSAGPLMAVFADYVHREALRIAGPKGRLEPPMLESLDEVANTIVVPLPTMVSDSGGRGIHIHASCQSKSQLASRWGKDDADTIWNCSTAKLVAGGLTVVADLQEVSDLCGKRVVGQDQHGNDILLPKLTPDEVREVAPMHATLIYRSAPATIVRITPAWDLLVQLGAASRTARLGAWLLRVWRWVRRARPVEVIPAPVTPRESTSLPLTIDVPAAPSAPDTVPPEWAEPAETRR